MRTAYRTHFQIDAKLSEVANAVRQWALSVDGLSEDHLDEWQGSIEDASAWRIWLSPSDSWRIEVVLAVEAETLVAEARVESQIGDGGVRLRLIPKLIEDFACIRDGQPLNNEAMRVDESNLEDFLTTTFQSQERSLPIVGVSLNDEGQTAIDPDEVQQKLGGLARIAVWNSDLSRSLVQRFGRQFACYGGAVRVYLPRPSPTDPRQRHPFFVWSSARGRGFLRKLVDITVDRSLANDPPTTGREIVERILSEQAAQNADQMSATAEENERLRRENARLEEQVEAAAEYMANEMSQQTDSLSREPESIVEAVQLAEQECVHLEIFQTAIDSAKQSHYRHPRKVLEELRTLDRLGSRLSEGLTTESHIIRWLTEHNCDVSTESVSTMRLYGDRRQFRNDDGHLVEMQMHLKLGGGRGQDKSCRIHFIWSPLSFKIQVGHVGRHLQTQQS